MTGFALGATLLVILSLVFLLWPFRRRPAKADFSRQQLNAAIYRDQLAEVERDQADGTLSQADYEQARAELQRRLLEDSQNGEAKAEVAHPSRATPIALALVLPIGAIVLYLVLGTPDALNPQAVASPHQQQLNPADIERMVSDFAMPAQDEITATARRHSPHHIAGHTIRFYGVCAACVAGESAKSKKRR